MATARCRRAIWKRSCTASPAATPRCCSPPAIIENGLDIPNVNTIIVNDAWRFGLAQLYQLRGRVGRSTTQAYAYFLYQKSHTLTEEAQKRLQTILEASELGAGFRIALRDLEIRGAGSLLGAEQHGHVSTVGFDLYTRMLASAVDRLRGKDADEPDHEIRAVVDLPLAAYLPDDYMGTYAAKIREYQRLARLRTIGEVEEAIADIRDRFGDLPEPVANLAYLLRIKARAIALEIPSITVYGRELIVRVPTGLHVSRGVLLKKSDAASAAAIRASYGPTSSATASGRPSSWPSSTPSAAGTTTSRRLPRRRLQALGGLR